MKEFGINVAEGDVASTPDEAEKIARLLSTQDIVIKAQVHSGGRNKGVFDNGFKSGIHVCSSPEEAKGYALKMLNHRLRTPQSGPEGKLCSKLFIGKRVYVRKETYFALALDRATAGPVMIGSAFGGVDIEQVAREKPEAIIKIPVSYLHGPTDEQALQMAQGLGFRSQSCIKAAQQIKKLYHLFSTYDATLVEVNPFVETSESEVLCLDAKLNFDDNALFRQPKLVELSDPSQADERELEAAKHDLNFISLDGNIGCLVNGAGLAMATMDMIKLHGGEPANFLDVGGGATAKQVTEALKIISTDINVRAILINIFGGIMKCDIIALGILNAVKILNLRLPLVLRLQGTNVQEAKKLIEASGLRVIAADDLDEAAQKAVKVSQIVEMARNVRLDVSFELPL